MRNHLREGGRGEEKREEGRDGRKEEEMKVKRDEVSQKDEGKGEERRKEEKKGTRGIMRNLSEILELQYWPTMCLLIRLPELSGLCSSIYTTDELQPKKHITSLILAAEVVHISLVPALPTWP